MTLFIILLCPVTSLSFPSCGATATQPRVSHGWLEHMLCTLPSSDNRANCRQTSVSLKSFCVFSVCIPAFLTVLQLPSQNQSDCTVFWDSCCFKECHGHFQLHLPGPSSQSLLLQRKTLQYYNNRELIRGWIH